MRKASTRLPEQGTQTPSPAPDLIPAETKKPTENLHRDWNSKRGHIRAAHPCLNRFGLSFWYYERRARNSAHSRHLPYQPLDIARRTPDAVRA
jgi:hypothetical protein